MCTELDGVCRGSKVAVCAGQVLPTHRGTQGAPVAPPYAGRLDAVLTGLSATVLKALQGCRPECPKLVAAAETGDVALVRSLLDQSPSPNPDSTVGPRRRQELATRTPLMVAAKHSHLQVAEVLLQWGADPNATDRWGRTALRDAVYNRDLSLTDLLLSHGAVINPLHAAAVRHGLYADHIEPPLHDAIRSGSAAMVDHLIARGADPNAKCKRHMHPLAVALLWYESSMTTRVPPVGHGSNAVHGVEHAAAAGAATDDKTPHDQVSITMEASVYRQLVTPSERCAVIQALVRGGANVGTKSTQGRSMLSAAVQLGSTDLTMLLLMHGAHPDNGCTSDSLHPGLMPNQRSVVRRAAPLWTAAAAGNVRIVSMLLEAGADPRGLTRVDPLVRAAEECHNKACRDLLIRAVDAWTLKWSPRTHCALPNHVRKAVEAVVLCNHRNACIGWDVAAATDGTLPWLPPEVLLFIILSSLAGADFGAGGTTTCDTALK